MTISSLLPGLSDPVHDSQRIFRTILQTLSRPGHIATVSGLAEGPAPLNRASACVLLALADFETPVWLDEDALSEEVAAFIRFHCGAPIVADSRLASFAAIADAARMPALDRFALGDDAFPDRSGTVILQVPSLTGGPMLRLAGPGIDGTIAFAPAGLPADFPQMARDNHALFPRGVDFIFTCGDDVAALPRSTRIEV